MPLDTVIKKFGGFLDLAGKFFRFLTFVLYKNLGTFLVILKTFLGQPGNATGISLPGKSRNPPRFL